MRHLINALIFMALMAAFVFEAFTAGYMVEKYVSPRSGPCINSACDQPCGQSKKFKRHVGECVK